MNNSFPLKYIFGCVFAALLFSACKKDEYYQDSGTTPALYNGTVLDYLHEKPLHFDTVEAVIKLAGLENALRNDSLTFFAPTDRYVTSLLRGFNNRLYKMGKDTVKTLDEIPAIVWNKYMSMYIFRGVNLLRDYPQIDFDLLQVYGGQIYLSYNNTPMNIGVTYGSSGGVKYVGYRQLQLSFLRDPGSLSRINFINVAVASCNIQPHHAAVHVLRDSDGYFAFDSDNFLNDYLAYKQ
ncbi:hypothetical protein [Chitinophaga rhizosphaerae]|uniref:hypothetical protein n=1 Tax=Chitinophaga rhizosphaerae TaxID=1864947 RepID=UPI000F80366F|nr:hypothetical protein [Chitinophaga rhizosphaerae]